MIFIFGVSPIEKDFGPSQEIECTHCNNTRFWHLKRSRQMFSLFFIPLIPFSTKYQLSCPICGMNKELTKDEFQYAQDLATLNTEAVNRSYSEQEYTERKNKLQ